MSGYALPHGLAGEEQRLALMSTLLDPFEFACIERLGVGQGCRCLEFGCGNGSISLALAERVAPTGLVIASDIDLSYISRLKGPCLQVRRIDILQDPIEESSYDFVVARALLHHVPSARNCLQRMLTALKPGGVLLSIEPDMLPCTVAEPASMRAFWQGWLNWSVEAGIDYFLGRKIPAWLDSLGVEDIASEGHTAIFNGRIRLGKLLDGDDSRVAAILAQRGLHHNGAARRIRDLLSGSALLGQYHDVYRNLGKKGLFLMRAVLRYSVNFSYGLDKHLHPRF